MNSIALLDAQTIDKIAAGEVIERPSSIVKELVENAIDAGANAVTVEIKEGGISLVRVTDNGSGIPKDQVPLAFLRHATSKIRKVDDLLDVTSLGFRGEALSSIAAVSQVELITKTAESLTGVRYQIEGGKEKSLEEIGAPGGTTFLVRNLFYNTPARKKFLKTPATEAGYVGDLIGRIALSHPEVSFKFMADGQTKLHTSGNHNLKDCIYHLYGRDITQNLVAVSASSPIASITGFIGKPVVARGNRNCENYFVNGRWVKSSILAKAIEDAYRPYMMKHKYPFTALQLRILQGNLDVNVHPTKMELRFSDDEGIYQFVLDALGDALQSRELIVETGIGKEGEQKEKGPKKPARQSIPEPFENVRMASRAASYDFSPKSPDPSVREHGAAAFSDPALAAPERAGDAALPNPALAAQERARDAALPNPALAAPERAGAGAQLDLFESRLLDQGSVKDHRIVGQVFGTYWIVQFQDKLFFIDQHAAHEKVLYERTLADLRARAITSQYVSPPILLSLTPSEEAALRKYQDALAKIGFAVTDFADREYALSAVPAQLPGVAEKDLFLEILDALLAKQPPSASESVEERIAALSCKAAVKGNTRLSEEEARALIEDLLTLENPYHCPHGRPTIISMGKQELERKFKRIV